MSKPQVSRGQLLRTIDVLFGDEEGMLYVGRPVANRGALVSIEGGQKTVVYIDGIPLETTGATDERPVPEHLAHRIVSIVRMARGEDPDLHEELYQTLKFVKELSKNEPDDEV